MGLRFRRILWCGLVGGLLAVACTDTSTGLPTSDSADTAPPDQGVIDGGLSGDDAQAVVDGQAPLVDADTPRPPDMTVAPPPAPPPSSLTITSGAAVTRSSTHQGTIIVGPPSGRRASSTHTLTLGAAAPKMRSKTPPSGGSRDD